MQHPARDTDAQDLQVAPRAVLDAARNVNDHAFAQFDFFLIEGHSTLAGENIINFIGALVIVELGIGDFEVVNFRGRSILLVDEGADLAAGFRPGFYVTPMTADVFRWLCHDYINNDPVTRNRDSDLLLSCLKLWASIWPVKAATR